MKFLRVSSRILLLLLLFYFVHNALAVTLEQVIQIENLVIENARKAYQLGYNHGDKAVCKKLLVLGKQMQAEQLAQGHPQAGKFMYYTYAGLCYNACLDGVDAKNQNKDIWSVDYQLIKNDMERWGCVYYGVCNK